MSSARRCGSPRERAARALTSVKLRITQSGQVGANPFDTLTKIVVDLKEGAFGSSSSLEVGDFEATASNSSASSILNTPSDLVCAPSLSSSLFQYINLRGLTQVRLRFHKDDNDNHVADHLLFCSCTAVTASKRPVLIITYHVS